MLNVLITNNFFINLCLSEIGNVLTFANNDLCDKLALMKVIISCMWHMQHKPSGEIIQHKWNNWRIT